MIKFDSWKTGKPEIVDSTLRSVLLFNSEKTKGTREDLISNSVYAIVLSQKHGVSDTQIESLFKERFNAIIKEDQIHSILQRLEKKHLISRKENLYYVVEESEKERNYFVKLQKGTDELLNRIVEKTEKICGGVHNVDEKKVKDNLRAALSVYFNMFGYSLVGVKEKANEKVISGAVESAKKGLPAEYGDAVVMVLAELLSCPQGEDKEILEIWAHAYVVMAIMGFDPMLQNLKATKLRGKEFVVDTDVILNLMTNYAKYSETYKEMVRKLTTLGCKLVFPRLLLQEIKNHAEAARSRFSFDGSSLLAYSDDLLETEVENVFIEDYVKRKRKEASTGYSFQDYLDSIFDARYPSLLEEEIQDVFLNKVDFLEDPIPIADEAVFHQLKTSLLDLTLRNPKSGRRNMEENQRLCDVDASLYLYVYERVKCESDDSFLSNKMYLLTRTTKTIRAAEEIGVVKKNIICNPDALIAVLMEIGEIDVNEERLLNLFENPFLAYTGGKVWEQVEPLVQAGACLQPKHINWLHRCVDDRLDKILTMSDEEGKIAELKRLESKGLGGLFKEEELLRMKKELDDVSEERARLEKENEMLRAQLRLAKNPPQKVKYVGKAPNGTRNKKKKR